MALDLYAMAVRLDAPPCGAPSAPTPGHGRPPWTIRRSFSAVLTGLRRLADHHRPLARSGLDVIVMRD